MVEGMKEKGYIKRNIRKTGTAWWQKQSVFAYGYYMLGNALASKGFPNKQNQENFLQNLNSRWEGSSK